MGLTPPFQLQLKWSETSDSHLMRINLIIVSCFGLEPLPGIIRIYGGRHHVPYQ